MRLSRLSTLSTLLVLSAACDKGGSAEPPRDTIFFQSGFEEGVTIQETGASSCSGDVIGSDGSELGDWLTDLEASPVEKAVFCYGGADDYALAGGEVGQRGITLVEDPDQAENRALHTWIVEPAENYNDYDMDDAACSCVDGVDEDGVTCEDIPLDEDNLPMDGFDEQGTRKGRVQMSVQIDEDTSVSSFTYSIRLRLGEGFELINNDLMQGLNWMTLGEYWNQGPATINAGDRSRVTLSLIKETADSQLHFGLKMDTQADGEQGWELNWPEEEVEQLVSDNPAPVGEWFTLRVSLVAGDASSGQTTVDITYDNGDEERLFDVTGATIYPESQVTGFTTINPIKLYTGGTLVCWLKSLGLPLDAHWDDFVLEFPNQP